MKELNKLIDVLEARISQQNITNTNVSASSVGWHIEHCLLTIDVITERVKLSSAREYKSKFNFWKHVILAFQKIPRGNVKAPRIVQPESSHTEESLRAHVLRTRELIKVLPALDAGQCFTHPFLGSMNRNQTIRFLKVHTKHHLNIMKEIILTEGK